MSISTKIKFYAVFQFITFTAYFILGIAFIAFVFLGDQFDKIIGPVNRMAYFSRGIILVYSFQIATSLGITGSILVYIATGIILSSWIIGLQIVRTQDRNLLDSLFLLFVFVPLISNILCLMAQVSSNTIAISYTIDKQQEFKVQYAKIQESKTAKLKELKLELQKLKQK